LVSVCKLALLVLPALRGLAHQEQNVHVKGFP
jgi:hypothetical protein